MGILWHPGKHRRPSEPSLTAANSSALFENQEARARLLRSCAFCHSCGRHKTSGQVVSEVSVGRWSSGNRGLIFRSAGGSAPRRMVSVHAILLLFELARRARVLGQLYRLLIAPRSFQGLTIRLFPFAVGLLRPFTRLRQKLPARPCVLLCTVPQRLAYTTRRHRRHERVFPFETRGQAGYSSAAAEGTNHARYV